ncbi:MAG: hypothetical protein JWQ83_2274 [Lacunisphaera sp.]|nr:hypothetical protein [Lacunisphaera sp.]
MPIRHMTLRLLTAAAALALLAIPPVVSAQSQISASEEERLESLARANAEVYTPKTSVTVGFRMLGQGAKTHFGSLGNVPSNLTVPPAPASDGVVVRSYNNGYVDLDAPRPSEVDSNGVQTSTPGGRYTVQTTTNVTDADGNVIGTTSTVTGDFVSYTPGLTRYWSYIGNSQATAKPGYIAMSSYTATSDGGFKDAKQKTSGGIELQASHVMGRLSKRTEWSLLTGISLNSINDKANGDVAATLHTTTDFYSLNGQPAPVLPSTTDATTGVTTFTAYVGPSFADLPLPDGTAVTGGFETTAPITTTASSSSSSAVVGGTTVHGVWQVKGAYFLIKLGPSIRTQLTERFGINGSVGVAGAYAGSRYTANETFDIPDGNGGTVATSQESTASKFLGGFYADLNLEWAANERTGLFGGLTAQKIGAYDQVVEGRTARIDIGTTVGIRGGVTIKF